MNKRDRRVESTFEVNSRVFSNKVYSKYEGGQKFFYLLSTNTENCFDKIISDPFFFEFDFLIQRDLDVSSLVLAMIRRNNFALTPVRPSTRGKSPFLRMDITWKLEFLEPYSFSLILHEVPQLPGVLSLPVEIFISIFLYLPYDDIIKMETMQGFEGVFQSNYLWKELSHRDLKLTKEELEAVGFLKRGDQLEKTIKWRKIYEEDGDKDITDPIVMYHLKKKYTSIIKNPSSVIKKPRVMRTVIVRDKSTKSFSLHASPVICVCLCRKALRACELELEKEKIEKERLRATKRRNRSPWKKKMAEKKEEEPKKDKRKKSKKVDRRRWGGYFEHLLDEHERSSTIHRDKYRDFVDETDRSVKALVNEGMLDTCLFRTEELKATTKKGNKNNAGETGISILDHTTGEQVGKIVCHNLLQTKFTVVDTSDGKNEYQVASIKFKPTLMKCTMHVVIVDEETRVPYEGQKMEKAKRLNPQFKKKSVEGLRKYTTLDITVSEKLYGQNISKYFESDTCGFDSRSVYPVVFQSHPQCFVLKDADAEEKLGRAGSRYYGKWFVRMARVKRDEYEGGLKKIADAQSKTWMLDFFEPFSPLVSFAMSICSIRRKHTPHVIVQNFEKIL